MEPEQQSQGEGAVLAIPPRQEEVEQFIKANNPLDLGRETIKITDIDPEPFSGHFNFLVEGAGGRAVLRVKGPEWGSPIEGIENEYNILKYIEKYEVGPAPLFFDREGIKGRPVSLIEYLDGKLFTELSEADQKELLPTVATFISEVNSIPVDTDVLPFDYPLTSYMPHKEKWWKRVLEAKEHARLAPWCEKAETMLAHAEGMLEKFEPGLKNVIDRGDSCFVFVSSHASHLMVTEHGLRFLNWEGVRFGDPTFMMGVFLSSIAEAPYIEEARKIMVDTYLKERPVADFDNLLGQRILERAVSDYTWLLWRESKKPLTKPLDEATLQKWYDRAGKAIMA